MKRPFRKHPFQLGDRIMLIKMRDDPNPIPPGTKGTIINYGPCVNQKHVHVDVSWDINRSLSLVWPIDQFEVIDQIH